MAEYIVEKKQTSGGWTWAEPKGELIRCKDCKYHKKNGMCLSFLFYPRLDDFCSLAERKEE